MKPVVADRLPKPTPDDGVAMGSEYMDASSYLKQPARGKRVEESGGADHGAGGTAADAKKRQKK